MCPPLSLVGVRQVTWSIHLAFTKHLMHFRAPLKMVRKVGDPKACGLGLSLHHAGTRTCSQMSSNLRTKLGLGSSRCCCLPAANGACLAVLLQALPWEAPAPHSTSSLHCVSFPSLLYHPTGDNHTLSQPGVLKHVFMILLGSVF